MPTKLDSTLVAATLNPTWANKFATGVNASAWPYSANFVWQDTTSNATYCSASQALSTSG